MFKYARRMELCDPPLEEKCKTRVKLQYSRFEPVAAKRTDADAVSSMCAVHSLVLEWCSCLSSTIVDDQS